MPKEIDFKAARKLLESSEQPTDERLVYKELGDIKERLAILEEKYKPEIQSTVSLLNFLGVYLPQRYYEIIHDGVVNKLDLKAEAKKQGVSMDRMRALRNKVFTKMKESLNQT